VGLTVTPWDPALIRSRLPLKLGDKGPAQ
jgi:hypothetical protein